MKDLAKAVHPEYLPFDEASIRLRGPMQPIANLPSAYGEELRINTESLIRVLQIQAQVLERRMMPPKQHLCEETKQGEKALQNDARAQDEGQAQMRVRQRRQMGHLYQDQQISCETMQHNFLLFFSVP